MKRTLVVACVLLASVTVAQQNEPLPPVTLTVQVADEAGQPVADADVHCVVWKYQGLPRTEPVRDDERAKTGPDGACAFDGLTAGEYYLHIFKDDMWALERVYPHQERTNPAKVTIKPAAAVDGYVRTVAGEPIEGVLILSYQCLPLAQSGPDGRFRIPKTHIQLVKEGYGFLDYSFPEGDMEFVLFPGTVVEGTVVDDAGQPAPGAKVQYLEGIELTTGSDGKFRTMPLSQDERVNFNATYRTADAWYSAGESVEVGPAPLHSFELRLEKRAAVKPQSRRVPAPGDVVFAAFAQEQAQPELVPLNVTTVSGKVVMADTKQPVPARIFFDYSQEFMHRGPRTGADGSFKVENVPHNSAPFVRVEPLEPTLHVVEGTVQVRVGDAPVDNLLFTVEPGAAIRGKLVDHEGKTPPRQWVMLQGGGQQFPLQADTGEDGNFEFEHLAASRDYTLEAGGATVKVPAPAPGQVVEGIVLALPSPEAGYTVEGVVLDAGGAPAGGVNLTFRQELGGNPVFENSETDARGRFRLAFKQAGAAKVAAVYRHTFVKMGTIDERSGRQCPIVEGESFTVGEAPEPQQFRIVVQMPSREIALISGVVQDAEGKPLKPKLDVLSEESYSRGDRVGLGYFMVYPLPEKPFLLEFAVEKYKPRVLELGRDFNPGDRNVKVVLEKGPFGEGESVWTAVTGRPDTEEGTKAMLLGDEVRRKIEQYRRIAGPEPEPTRPAVEQPRPPEKLRIVVTDTQGQPISPITVQVGRVLGADSGVYAEPRQDNVVPAPNSPKQVMENAQGQYTVPNGSLVSAEGTARWMVFVRAGEKYEEPLRVTLGPAASLTVRVVNEKGKPVEGVAVVPAPDAWSHQSYNYHYVAKTNSQGVVTLEDLPAGTYVYSIHRTDTAPNPPEQRVAPYVGLRLDWGEKAEREFVLAPITPDSPEGILQSVSEHIYRAEEMKERLDALDPDARAELGRFVVDRLENIPVLESATARSAGLLARVAADLGKEKAADPIRAMLAAPSADPRMDVGMGAEQVAKALADLEGNKAAEFFGSLAGNDAIRPQIRQWAVIGLGRIGTEKSVKVFKGLRDAAYAKPGAPQKLESYTHAERMREAAFMTMYLIPGTLAQMQAHVPPPAWTPGVDSFGEAWVSPDYSEGALGTGADTLHMKRLGDEWLVIDIERGPVP